MSQSPAEAVEIVDACSTDFASITRIFQFYVQNEIVTFELEPPDQEEMWSRAVKARRNGLPFLAAYMGDKVVGYAYATEFRPPLAYALTIEDSVYVDPEYKRRGIGAKLLDALIRACTAAGKREMVAVISGDEEGRRASVRLHETVGFVHVGVLTGVGSKFGKSIDDVLMQLRLNAV